MSVREWGWKGADSAGIGRVISAHGDYYRVVCDEGEGIARKKSSVYRNPEAIQPSTGDFVRLEWNPQGESRIVETLPRLSELKRLDPSGSGYREQVVAVNFDTIFCVTSLNANFSVPRLERFVALAEASHVDSRVVILLSKCDLAPERDSYIEALAPFAGRFPILPVSAKTGEGVPALSEWVRSGTTTAFTGSSGVGKSSLVNALAGAFIQDTCEIQEWSDKGRHTTTVRELFRLPSGALVLDTPGLREFGIPGELSVRFHSSGTHRYR